MCSLHPGSCPIEVADSSIEAKVSVVELKNDFAMNKHLSSASLVHSLKSNVRFANFGNIILYHLISHLQHPTPELSGSDFHALPQFPFHFHGRHSCYRGCNPSFKEPQHITVIAPIVLPLHKVLHAINWMVQSTRIHNLGYTGSRWQRPLRLESNARES